MEPRGMWCSNHICEREEVRQKSTPIYPSANPHHACRHSAAPSFTTVAQEMTRPRLYLCHELYTNSTYEMT